MKTEQEKFIDLIDYEGLYKISNFGNVINKKGVIIGIHKASKVSMKIYLSKNSIQEGFIVQHLVAKHFIERYKEDHNIIKNKDGDINNNKVSNLQICQPKSIQEKDNENSCFKVSDDRNRLLLVTPEKARAVSFVRSRLENKSFKIKMDSLIEGQFIIRCHIQKQIFEINAPEPMPISLVNDKTDQELIGSLYK